MLRVSTKGSAYLVEDLALNQSCLLQFESKLAFLNEAVSCSSVAHCACCFCLAIEDHKGELSLGPTGWKAESLLVILP